MQCWVRTLTPLLVRPVEVMSEAAKREAYPSLEGQFIILCTTATPQLFTTCRQLTHFVAMRISCPGLHLRTHLLYVWFWYHSLLLGNIILLISACACNNARLGLLPQRVALAQRDDRQTPRRNRRESLLNIHTYIHTYIHTLRIVGASSWDHLIHT